MSYAVIQFRVRNNSIIFGIGETKWDALTDASRYTDNPCMGADEYVGNGCPDDYATVVDASNDIRNMSDGELYVVRCSPDLAEYVSEHGGDIRFDISDGYAYRPEDIEGN